MLEVIKNVLRKNPVTKKACQRIKYYLKGFELYRKTGKELDKIKREGSLIFYLGIPAHSNLGDLAQGVCIRHWLKNHYSDFKVVEIETNALVNTPLSLLNKLAELYKPGDFIVFQSGYTTTDLGGYADEMHRAVMKILPDADMLMLPQTIFFKDDKNKERTSKCYNSMKNMLFLARDRVSFEMAEKMFPNISVMQFPDIVTTLIGKLWFEYKREGILFCCRDDGEKYYSDVDIKCLMDKCSKICKVDKTDTTKKEKMQNIVRNAEGYIMKEIDSYAHYKVVITDRYHGTIFSLVAGTPVVIIKTTDHKVTTGAEWFKGVYDDYVYVSDSLECAYTLAMGLLNKSLSNKLIPYFEENYYDKLPDIFDYIIRKQKNEDM